MEKISRLTAPAGEKFRQLQKMIHEIKNNERGIMQKMKSLTNKVPPSVPRRDYVTEEEEEDGWSDEFADEESGSDYENPNEHSENEETYVEPSEEADPEDANYEPPPCEEPKFTPSYKFSDRNGGYADKSKPTRQALKKDASPKSQQLPAPPNKPLPNPYPKPNVMPRNQRAPIMSRNPLRPQHQGQDDEDYINPEEDDNYIEPTTSPSPSPKSFKPPVLPPSVNRAIKPGQSPVAKTSNRVEEPALYEVPENESKPSPPGRGVPVPRRSFPPKLEQEETYEECVDDDRRPDVPKKPGPPPPITPTVKPRVVPRKPRIPDESPKDLNRNKDKPQVAERHVHSSVSAPPPLPTSTSRPSLPKINVQKPPEPASRYVVNSSRSTVEQEAGVAFKEWYSPSCGRKAAEEALQASSKDGSFLVRRSTGQDSNQPFTLVVFFNRRVYNIPVRYIESPRGYALGRAKTGEEKFSSVAEMIENHQRAQLVLVDSHTNTKDFTKLVYPVRVP